MRLQDLLLYQIQFKRDANLFNVSDEIEAAIEVNPEIWFSA
jgi:hypothetical protein